MKKFYLLLILSLFIPTYLNAAQSVTAIAPDELRKMQQDEANFKLIDARDEKAFDKEHIVGAVSLPVDKVNSESLSNLASDIKTKLVFYCDDTGTSSHIASQKAIGAGYQYVYRYAAGIDDWKKLGYPTEKGK